MGWEIVVVNAAVTDGFWLPAAGSEKQQRVRSMGI